jgi:hypothetical protein
MGLLRKKRFDSYAAFPVVKAAHPRFALMQSTKTWMAGPSPAMTKEQDPCHPIHLFPSKPYVRCRFQNTGIPCSTPDRLARYADCR